MKLKYMCNMQHLHARIVVCLLTLKKAFDTFDHNILLDKLNFYSFHGLINQWFPHISITGPKLLKLLITYQIKP